MSNLPGTVTCPTCQHNSGNRIIFTHTSSWKKTEFSCYHCPQCQLEFWWPLVIIPEFYSDEGFAAYSDYHSGNRPFPPWAKPFFKRVLHKGGNILDVGCGDGTFLERARNAGYKTHGIDLDHNSIAVARNKRGLQNIECVTLQEYAHGPREKQSHFDVITFFEVLEHQDDPTGFLRTIGDLLTNNGIICGSVPNRNRFLARIDRRLDEGDLPPHHFLWFSVNSLSDLLERTGYQPELIHPSGNIDFSQLNSKVAGLISKLLRIGNTQTGIIHSLLSVASIPAAAFLWFGFRAWPAHIFFIARIKN